MSETAIDLGSSSKSMDSRMQGGEKYHREGKKGTGATLRHEIRSDSFLVENPSAKKLMLPRPLQAFTP